MGGGSSKEKRKLKRLQTVGGNGTDVAAPSTSAAEAPKPSGKKKDSLFSATTKKIGTSDGVSNGNDRDSPHANAPNAVLRLRRKLERKAAGKFKLASVDKAPPQTDQRQSRSQQKRKPIDRDNSSSKRPKRNGTAQPDGNRKSPVSKKPPSKKTPKKKTDSAKKKPKHLNRKMTQLSKSLTDGGGNIAELEAQMNQLKQQIEVMKSMKGCPGITSADDKKPDSAVEEDTKIKDNGNESESSRSSSSSSCSEESSSTPKERVPKQATTKHKIDSSSSSSSSEDDSSDEEVKEENNRSRGKRRRGRREKSSVVEVDGGDSDDVTEETKAKEDSETADEKSSAEKEKTPSKKTSKKDDTRRCIGRKPVTDYAVGQKYSGTVKYIKSTMGAFIDVGSHSDAFCHISCISDGYAKTVEEVVSVGDEVEVRVVEVNREKKRLTVSLRSDEMAEIELEKLQSKQKKTPRGEKKSGHTRFEADDKKSGHSRFDFGQSEKQVKTESKQNVVHYSNESESKWGAKSESVPSSGVKTGADLKRERKLARRAERRAQAMAG